MHHQEDQPPGYTQDTPHATIRIWVESYTSHLYTWACNKVTDNALAEDLVQETFVSAFQSFSSFRQDSSPKTWLFSILNHKIIDHLRKKMREPFTSDGGASLDYYFNHHEEWKKEARPKDWTLDEPHLLDSPDFRSTLQQCMHRLPGKWNQALQLKYLDEKEGKDICHELELSPSNFWQLLHRAKLQLRKCLELHWFKK